MPAQNLRGEWGENGAAENDVGGRCQSQEMPSFRINGGKKKNMGFAQLAMQQTPPPGEMA